jgi:hypothetical protein
MAESNGAFVVDDTDDDDGSGLSASERLLRSSIRGEFEAGNTGDGALAAAQGTFATQADREEAVLALEEAALAGEEPVLARAANSNLKFAGLTQNLGQL